MLGLHCPLAHSGLVPIGAVLCARPPLCRDKEVRHEEESGGLSSVSSITAGAGRAQPVGSTGVELPQRDPVQDGTGGTVCGPRRRAQPRYTQQVHERIEKGAAATPRTPGHAGACMQTLAARRRISMPRQPLLLRAQHVMCTPCQQETSTCLCSRARSSGVAAFLSVVSWTRRGAVQGVANMGAFVKHTSTKASAAVNQGMHKLRQPQSPRQAGTPTFEEALAELPFVRGASSSLPDLGPEASMETSGSESDVLRTDSQASDSLRLSTEPSMAAPAAAKASEDSAEFVHVPTSAAEPTEAAAAAGSTLLPDEGQRRSSSVFVRVQASDLKVVGEKGTKVPNFTVKELALLLECRMEAAFEWTELDGWRPTHKLKLSITQLEHSISGTTVPVPKTLLKYLLNLLLPAVIEARLLAVLPAEVGQYFIGKDTPGVQLGGRLHVYGPSLTTLNADLAADPAAAAAAAAAAALGARSPAAAHATLRATRTACSQLPCATDTGCCAARPACKVHLAGHSCLPRMRAHSVACRSCNPSPDPRERRAQGSAAFAAGAHPGRAGRSRMHRASGPLTCRLQGKESRGCVGARYGRPHLPRAFPRAVHCAFRPPLLEALMHPASQRALAEHLQSLPPPLAACRPLRPARPVEVGPAPRHGRAVHLPQRSQDQLAGPLRKDP